MLDETVYIGSSNLDPRSLRLNFEIMLRLTHPGLAARARREFGQDLARGRRVTAGNSWQQWSFGMRVR